MDYANSAFSPGNLDAVTTDTTTQDTVNYDIGTPGTNPLSKETADARATRFHLGLKDHLDGASPDDISGKLQQGDEPVVREQASSSIDNKKSTDQINATLNSKDPNAARILLHPFKPTDPQTVAETAYGEKYMNKLYDSAYNIQDSFMNQAMENIPEVVTMTKQTASGVAASIQYAMGKSEDAEEAVKNQGTLPWLADTAKGMLIPGYRSYMQGTGLIGNTELYYELDAKAQQLLTENPNLKDFKPKFDAIYDKLLESNPQQAALFANAVVGFSAHEKFLGSVLNTVDTVGAASGAFGMAKLVNNVRRAYQTGVRASATRTPSPASVAEGFGDINEAAVQRASETLRQGSDGTYRPIDNNLSTGSATPPSGTPAPMQAGLDALPTGLRTDHQAIVQDAQNTGSLSRELTTRLTQDYLNSEQKFIENRVNTPTIQRTGLDYATPEQLRAVSKEVVDKMYPGVNNMVLDYTHPIYDELSKTYRIQVKFGDYNAQQFLTEDQARARMLQEGFADGGVEGVSGKHGYLPEGALVRSVKKGRDWTQESSFGRTEVKDGSLRYWDKDGIEYEVTTKPEKGMVPVSLETSTEASGYTPKFHPTLKTDAEAQAATIVQHGLGFNFNAWINMPEDGHLVRDGLVNLEGARSIATTPGLNRWVNKTLGFGYVRNSDNTLAAFETHQRKTATYAINNYHELISEQMRMVEDVARGRVRVKADGTERNPIISKLDSLGHKLTRRRVWDEFKRTLAYGPHADVPGKPGEKGYFFQTPSELNSFYLDKFQRMPSFTETRGYFAFTRAYEYDRLFRGLSEYSYKAQVGAMQHQFEIPKQNVEVLKSGFFEGTTLNKFPTKDYPIARIERDGTVKVLKIANAGSNYEKWNKAIQQGTEQAVEVYNPELFPFDHIPELKGQFIRYVIAPKFEKKNLDWNQINRKSGGHFDYDFDDSIKYAHMQRIQIGDGASEHLYLGDKTFSLVKNRAQGEMIVKKLNEAHDIQPTNEAAAKQIIQNELGIPWEKWKTEYPKIPNMTNPFRVVPKNGSIASLDNTLKDYYKDSFKDGTHSSSMARHRQTQYNQLRDSDDLMTMGVEGTKNNPIIKYQPAEFVDPIETMSRALNNITKTSFMDDQKLVSMHLWLNEARPYLNAEMTKRMTASPYSTFLNAVDKKSFLPDAPPEIVKNLLSNRYKTKLFLGMPSSWDTEMHQLSQKLADQAFDKLGPKSDLIPFWLLGKVDSPLGALRAMAYHFKMGLWSPHQLVTQSQSFVTIASVAPRSAVGATLANFLHEYALYNHTPEMLNTLDKIAVDVSSKFPGVHSFKTGEWKEIFNHLMNSGFPKVGDEYSALDTQLGKSWIRNEAGKMLDAATFFFKGIESRVRRGAYYTAGLEEKRTSETGMPFTKSQVAKVLDRADDLAGNMSRATNSILQSGPMSPLTMFQKYQIGLAEYFWSPTRLGATATERNMARLRMVLAYQMIFGMAGTIGLGGLPMGDYFRKVALDHDYVVGDNWISTMLMEGPTSTALAWLSSGDKHDVKKGNFYNLAKFGANGITAISDLFDILNGDKSAWESIPATSIGYNAWKDSGGIRADIASMFPGHEADAVTHVTADHLVKILSEITTADSAIRAQAAYGTGKWMSRQGQPQGDVTKLNATLMAITGFSMRKFDDNFLYDQMAKSDKKTNEYFKMRAQQELAHIGDTIDNKDRGQYLNYIANAFAWLFAGDVPVEQYPSVLAGSLKRQEDKITTSRYNYAFGKDTPESKRPGHQDAFKKFEQNEQQ